MAKKTKVDLIAALHEALLSVPDDSFTVARAREAVVETFLHKDNLTTALKSMVVKAYWRGLKGGGSGSPPTRGAASACAW